MKPILFVILSVVIFLNACGSKNDETSIPDSAAVENLSEASLNILNESIDDDPSNDLLYYKRALFYYHRHNISKALLDINKAIEIEEDKGDYYLLQGEAYYENGNLLLAKEASLKAESLLENVPALMVLQSNIYLDLKDTVKYNAYINKTVQLIPFKADADFVLARKYLITKDSVRSLAFFQSAVKKDPDYLPAYKEIIKIYMHKAMYDSSMSYVLNGIRISHQTPLFYEAEGRFFEKIRLFGAAESAYLIALKYSNKNPEYYKLLGELKYRLNDYVKALSWYSLLLANNPRDLSLLNKCADLAFRGKEWSKASYYYAKLMEIDATNDSYKNYHQLAIKHAYQTDTLYAKDQKHAVVEDLSVKTTSNSPKPQSLPDTLKKTLTTEE
jgi:tetratricopeptide (TPR) repeat protein